MIKKSFYALMASAIMAYSNIYSKTIIYDYNGVLTSIDSLGMASEIGFGDTLFYYFLDINTSSDIEKRLYKTVEAIGGKQQAEHLVCGNNGRPLPELMCRWMDGRFDAKAEKKAILEKLHELRKKGFFKNSREYRFMKNTITMMFFKPELINKHRKPIKKMMKMAHAIKATGKHRQLLLSNMDKLCFDDLLKRQIGNELLELIPQEDIIISAHINYNKPHPNAFTYILQKYQLDPAECIFIDDQLENVLAARKLGITALLVKNKNYKEIAQALRKLGVKH